MSFRKAVSICIDIAFLLLVRFVQIPYLTKEIDG